MPQLNIQRTHEILNFAGTYQIFLDEQQIGTIANGELKSFPVEVGEHTLYAKIDWCRSREVRFLVNANETKNLKIVGFKAAKGIILSIIFILTLHFLLDNIFHFQWAILVIIFPFLVLFYYLTLGRNKYLIISET